MRWGFGATEGERGAKTLYEVKGGCFYEVKGGAFYEVKGFGLHFGGFFGRFSGRKFGKIFGKLSAVKNSRNLTEKTIKIKT